MTRCTPTLVEVPQVLERYRTRNGDTAQVIDAGQGCFDVEILRDGDLVDYLEDLSAFALLLHVRCEGWEPEP